MRRPPRIRPFAVPAVAACLWVAVSEAEVRRIGIDDFDDCARDRFIEATEAVRLAPSWLLTHEMGVSARHPERLGPERRARVLFHLPSADVTGATLLLYVNRHAVTGEPMQVHVNGHRLLHLTDRERMLTGGWDRLELPPELLRDGDNEIDFSHAGVLHVDAAAGGHSQRSVDGGRTWQSLSLGSEPDVPGEYMVRLRLRGHPPAGQITSPVIDLADPTASGAIAPVVAQRRVRLSLRRQTPPGTGIVVELRTGETPVHDAATWGEWTTETSVDVAGRYLQWRARLTSSSPAATPQLQGLDLVVDSDAATASRLRLLALDQPRIARSSYAFESMAPHPRVTQLLEENDLAAVVAGGRDDDERLDLLRHWVHDQWIGWQSDEHPYCPTWDPLEILHVTRNDLGYGMCTHYSAVFAGCAQALGYTARVTILDHHCVAEVWSEARQKWVLQDPGPSRDYNGHYTLDGVPANALELHRAFVAGRIGEARLHLVDGAPAGRMRDNIAATFTRFGIALRNDHLVHAEPAELEHGQDEYHWDGYLWWTDSLDPRYPEYSLQTARAEDLYWGVNQTRLYLQETGEPSGDLRVDLETVTPNFSHFIVQRDDGDWTRWDAASLRWSLGNGENRLAVRSVNLYGRPGRIARATVERRVLPTP